MKMLVSFFVLNFLLHLVAGDKIVVDTDCGTVQGKKFTETVKSQGKTVDVYEFRNIPYAVPPVGPLRWRPPIRLSKNPKKCWNGTLAYDEKKRVACKQIYTRDPTLNTTEDCLVLTVRTPNISATSKLPVMVWIHGGGMMWGFNEMYAYHPDTEFSAYMNVVTVSINYRLNFFGFLSLKELWITEGSNESYGNYGIIDQIEALKWVQNNIHAFGGDPKKVTIYGESGGGTAVYCLLGSPLAKGLFQKASAASGAPNIRTTHIEANELFRGILTKTNCSQSRDVITCLQNLNGDDLLQMYKGVSMLTYHSDFPENVPYKGLPIEIIDPVVVTKSPDELPFETEESLDLLIGNCAQEIGPEPLNPTPDPHITTWDQLTNYLVPKINTFKTGLFPFVADYYRTDRKDPPANMTPQYMYELIASDVLLICSTSEIVKRFTHIPSFRTTRYIVSQPPTKAIGLGVETAYHGWDSVALFGLKFFKGDKLPEADKNLMQSIRGLYKDFMDSKYMDFFVNKTVDFWRGSMPTQPIGGYHRVECEIWKEFDFLSFSWGNLGKNNYINKKK